MSGRPQKVPFLDEFAERLLSGRKYATSRLKPIGKAGDIFTAFGARFALKSVRQETLDWIAKCGYYAEGFATPSAFRNIWKKIHHRRGWSPSQVVWYHEFELLPDKPAHPKGDA